MIEKFNFYDIYGYLLPGLILVGVLWVPFGLALHFWPSGSWESVLTVAAIAYVFGILLQGIVGGVVPSKTRLGGRNPSAALLDAHGATLSPQVQTELAAQVKAHLKLTLPINEDGTLDIDKTREDISLIVRHLLIREKGTSYAEQMQGMYTLLRGIIGSLSIAFFYWIGWALAIFYVKWVHVLACIGLVVAILVASWIVVDLVILRRFRNSKSSETGWRLYAYMWLIAALTVGYLLGSYYGTSRASSIVLLVGSLCCFPTVIRSYEQYKRFTDHYAGTIWRDFIALTSERNAPSASNSSQ
ncbi:MAG: hypothetical protein ACRD3Q_19240 [Terriglobales bacterium]